MSASRIPASVREPLEVLLGGRLRRRAAQLLAALLLMLGLHLVIAEQFDLGQALTMMFAGEIAMLVIRDPTAPQPSPAMERAARALGFRLIGYTILLLPLLLVALAALLSSSLASTGTVIAAITGMGAAIAVGIGIALLQLNSNRWRRMSTPARPIQSPFLAVGVEVLLLAWLGYELYARRSTDGVLAWWRLSGAAMAIAASGIAFANPPWTAAQEVDA